VPLLPDTDGTIVLYQGRDCQFTVRILDRLTKQPQLADGYELHMQIRASIESDVLIDCGDFDTSNPTALTADVSIPGAISGALDVPRVEADWIADAKFVKGDSAIHAARYTVQFIPEVTRS